MSREFSFAPAWQVAQWFNTEQPLTLDGLRGRVVVLEAFQMLCPGCVTHGLPQAARVQAAFPAAQVQVVGLHTVFEHHAAMTPVSLQAFLHEYRIGFPVGVDTPSPRGPIPLTMERYGMRGTPTLVVIDAAGRIRHHHFGQVGDLALGAQIATLIDEARRAPIVDARSDGTPGQAAFDRAPSPAVCSTDGCELPAVR